MKYILVLILLSIGILTLLKLRGVYIHERLGKFDTKIKETDQLQKPRLVLGTAYIGIAFGILFNFFTLFLMIILDPLPDRLIFNFINFHGYIDPYVMNRIIDLNSALYPHEQIIYYCIAIASFSVFIELIVSIWYLIHGISYHPKIAFSLLITGLITEILTGFTTFLPFML